MGVHSQSSHYVPLNPEDASYVDNTENSANDTENEIPEESVPFPSKTMSQGIVWTEEGPIYVLAETATSQPIAYGKKYPGTSYAAIQQVKNTQQDYTEALASADVQATLGKPTAEWVLGHGACLDGTTGQLAIAYHVIKTEGPPKNMAVVRYCNDGLQSIGSMRIP